MTLHTLCKIINKLTTFILYPNNDYAYVLRKRIFNTIAVYVLFSEAMVLTN